MKSALTAAADHPRAVSVVGAISGWGAVDLLYTAQITAAILASIVSVCSLILITPKVAEVLLGWRAAFRSRK